MGTYHDGINPHAAADLLHKALLQKSVLTASPSLCHFFPIHSFTFTLLVAAATETAHLVPSLFGFLSIFLQSFEVWLFFARMN